MDVFTSVKLKGHISLSWYLTLGHISLPEQFWETSVLCRNPPSRLHLVSELSVTI